MSRLGNYLRDTQAELKHVSWPTQRQAMVYTLLVIIIAGVTAVFVGLADHLFTKVLDLIIFNY